jgi:hypothetical protein
MALKHHQYQAAITATDTLSCYELLTLMTPKPLTLAYHVQGQ